MDYIQGKTDAPLTPSETLVIGSMPSVLYSALFHMSTLIGQSPTTERSHELLQAVDDITHARLVSPEKFEPAINNQLSNK